MKTFKRASLPETIHYNGDDYKVHIASSAAIFNTSDAKRECNKFSSHGTKAVLVEVQPSQLRGVSDLHGQPYKPSIFLFTVVPSAQAE